MSHVHRVALLAEGVDRNEIMYSPQGVWTLVALLAEGVDRNKMVSVWALIAVGRPPRGGRG